MDEFALRSQHLAARAIANGLWAREFTPVTLPDGTVVDADDCPRPGVTLDGLAGLKPAFGVGGTVTALGHPYGMTGARLITTMLNSFDWHDQSTGLNTMCVGGGQGMALILERV